MRYLEDFRVGATYPVGSKTVSEAEIVRFAREFDPQYFHVDPVAASDSVFGGVVASGWHTCAIFMRLIVNAIFRDTANLAGLQVNDLRWLVPVRPGDTLHGEATVTDMRPSRTKPDRGVLGLRFSLTNQRGELVWHAASWSLVRRDPAPASS